MPASTPRPRPTFRDLASATAKATIGIRKRLDAVEARGDVSAKHLDVVEALTLKLNQALAANELLSSRLDAVTAEVVDLGAQLTAAITAAGQHAAALGERVDAVAAIAAAEHDDAQARTGVSLDEVRAAVLSLSGRVEFVDKEFGAAIERAEHAHGELSERFDDHKRETAERVAALTSKLPRSVIVDQAGNIVVFDCSGDQSTIGTVSAERGRDAPSITGIAWKHGHLVTSMSDGTSFLTELPAPPAPEPIVVRVEVPALPVVTKRTPEGDKVKDTVRFAILMGRGVDTVDAIAERYNLSPETVRQIIGDHKNG